MKATVFKEVTYYNLSTVKALPDWISDRQRRNLNRDNADLRERVQLVQDLNMPSSCHNLHITPDNSYLWATGAYKPVVKCYDLKGMVLKFERGVDHVIKRVCCLSDDYTKPVFLMADRFIEFHTGNGLFHRIRTPHQGYDLSFYHRGSELIVPSGSSYIYRINLHLGRFMTPLQSSASYVNCSDISSYHNLLLFGTSDGFVEACDPRVPKIVNKLEISDGSALTSLKWVDELKFATGSSTGHVYLYDVRSSVPLLVKDHFYGQPIKNIEYHSSQRLILSMDSKSLRVWNVLNGETVCNIEGDVPYNCFVRYPDSGLLLVGSDQPDIETIFVPAFGPAPKWCSYLDQVVDNVESSNKENSIYDDYKFMTRNDLDAVGLGHLIGTKYLRAYMHGFFITTQLYSKLCHVPEVNETENVPEENLIEKVVKKAPRKESFVFINSHIAERLEDSENKSSNLMKVYKDDRFSTLFTNPDMNIERDNPEYIMHERMYSKVFKLTEENTVDDLMEGEDRKKRYEETLNKLKHITEQSEEHPDSKAVLLCTSAHLEDVTGNKAIDTKKEVMKSRVKKLNGDVTANPDGGLTKTFRPPKRHESRVQKRIEHHRQERKNLRRSASGLFKKRK